MGQQRLFNPKDSPEPAVAPSPHVQDITHAFSEAAENLDAYTKSLSRLQAACRRLAAPETWMSPAKCKAVLEELATRIEEQQQPPDWPAGLLGKAEEAVRRLEQSLLRGAVSELERRCQAESLTFQCISRSDFEYRVGPMTVTLDPPKGSSRISYSREYVADAVLDPEKIWKELVLGTKSLQSAYGGAEPFFKELLLAYRGLLGEKGAKFGERVEIVDLPGRISARRQPRRFWSDPTGQKFHPVSRAMLAFGLDRLIREKGLVQGGHRLRLGSATMDSTKKKIDVLYLEKGQSGGQFYLTLWFERTSEKDS